MSDKQKPDRTFEPELEKVSGGFAPDTDLNSVAGGAIPDDTLDGISGGGAAYTEEEDTSGV